MLEFYRNQYHLQLKLTGNASEAPTIVKQKTISFSTSPRASK